MPNSKLHHTSAFPPHHAGAQLFFFFLARFFAQIHLHKIKEMVGQRGARKFLVILDCRFAAIAALIYVENCHWVDVATPNKVLSIVIELQLRT